MKKEYNFSIKSTIIIVIITSVVTSLVTGLILYNNSKILIGSSNLQTDTALQEFLQVYYDLEDDYYTDIDKTKMIDQAIAAMLDYLGEDYSTYMNQDETADLENHLSGQYVGIGISITNGNQIVKVYQDTPASRVGLLDNDVITSINGTSTEGLDQSAVSALISKTEENTITINRNGQTHTFKVTAETINSPLISEIYEENNKRIGYILIESFTNTVEEEFAKSLTDLESQGIDSLIIDVRSNTGGYLKGATAIASMFLEKGKTIYSLEGKDSTDVYVDETDEKRDYPVMILMNDGTASASEVLAAALKENYGATLLGTTSYGKGKVQLTKSLEDGSMVKYTTARWLTPSGECIDEIGLDPDYLVNLEKDAETGLYTDTQLEKARELLSQ